LKTLEGSCQKKGKMEKQHIEKIFEKVLCSKGLINPDDSALIFYYLDFVEKKIIKLRKLFPENTLYTIAVKANPLPSILKKLKTAETGAETASLPELVIALKSGFKKNKYLFDSPVKTREELEFALKAGVHINADSLMEVRRISEIKQNNQSKSIIGLRINPQAGIGKIEITSVAGSYSKFGVPVQDFRNEIIGAYIQNDWLTAIHVHVGSQGCEIPLLIKGIKIVYELALEINKQLEMSGKQHRIRVFDMGGGLPVAYKDEDSPPTMEEYVGALRSEMPKLFDGTFSLITEFGRWIHANAGFTISRVEYLKTPKGKGNEPNVATTDEVNTIMIHVGADLLIRECYLPNQWSHKISVADRAGRIKPGNAWKKYTIAGPLCFQGDIIAKDIYLPEVEEGDYIIIHDTGAYTLSMWSRYNSRQMPKVIGFSQNDDHFEILRKRETREDLWEFWS
jgi:diaminopimelate decarboxylase